MTFSFARVLSWSAIFGLGVVVGAVGIPNHDPSLTAAARATPNTLLNGSVSDSQAASLAASLPAGFEQRLYTHLNSVVQAAVADAIARQPSKTVAATAASKGADNATLTDNQIQTYETLRTRLTSHSLTWSQLTSAPEMAQLPSSWREKIINQAVEMLNRGELAPAQFIDER